MTRVWFMTGGICMKYVMFAPKKTEIILSTRTDFSASLWFLNKKLPARLECVVLWKDANGKFYEWLRGLKDLYIKIYNSVIPVHNDKYCSEFRCDDIITQLRFILTLHLKNLSSSDWLDETSQPRPAREILNCTIILV